MKQINNDYNTNAHLWWSDDEGTFSSIRYFVHPVRVSYFREVMGRTHTEGYAGLSALDVGCGGGFLSEDLAKAGLRVTGIDPSEGSLRAAAAHARESGLRIEYRTGSGESIPFADGSFDMAFCCDVLEHVGDVGAVIGEIARVLKKGGLFFFDTINRTLESRIAVIFMLQECPLTAFGTPDRHMWRMFIKPDELAAVLGQHGISCQGLKGIMPTNMGLPTLLGLYRASRRRITYKELGNIMQFAASDDLDCSYMGYGIRAGG
jgi:2-polyprenyl-6-hydroxyphenyl methylase / 3-demethylubiquinone-9 3-methyltransferase